MSDQPTMIPLSQASPDNPYYQAYQASIKQPVVSLQESQAALQQAQLAAKQSQFWAQAEDTFNKTGNGGAVDPQTYNSVKNQAASLGIDSPTFDSRFMTNYTDPSGLYYNTDNAYGNRSALGGVTREIEAKLDQYKNIPSFQKGPVMGKLAGSFLGQYISPEATTYEGQRSGLAAQLKSLLGGQTGIRVTSSQLEGWANLIPSASDSEAVAKDKIKALDADIKATFNSKTGLDSRYMPQEQTQNNTAGVVPPTSAPGNTDITDLNAPNATETMKNFINKSMNPDRGGNGLLQFLLPTGGAIAGGALGALVPGFGETGASEIGGAGIGGGAGKWLADLLTGQKPGWDVPVTGGLTAVAGLGGKLLGGALGDAAPAVTDVAGGAGAATTEEAIASNTGNPVVPDVIKSLTTLGKQGGQKGAAAEMEAAAAKGADMNWEDISSQAQKAVENRSPQVQKAMNSLLVEQQPTPSTIGSNYGPTIGPQTLTSPGALDMRRNLASRLSKNVFGQLNIPATNEEQQAANILRQVVTKNLKTAAPDIVNPDKLYSFYSKMHGDAPTWAKRILAGYATDKLVGEKIGGPSRDLLDLLVGVGAGIR